MRLVLVHGTQMSAAQWFGYSTWLGPDVEVVAVDLPAHGSRAAEAFTWEGALAVIEEAVGAAPADRPVVLAGHSLGGYLAIAHAARHPDALAALVAFGSSAVPRGPGAAAYRLFCRWAQRAGTERMSRVMEGNLRRVIDDEDYLAALRHGGYPVAGMSPSWQAVMQHCGPELLAEVRCPVWLVNGQFDQLRVHARRYAAAARRSPRVEVVTLARRMHIFPMTHRRQTATLLARVISSLPPVPTPSVR